MGGRRTVGGLAIAALAVWLFSESKKHKELEALPPARRIAAVPLATPPAPTAVRARRSWRRRTATTLAFTALFFAGAALTAGAGNELAHVDAASTDATQVDVATTDATTDTATTTDAETTTTDEATTTEAAAPDTAAAPTEEDVPAAGPDPSDATPATTPAPAVQPAQEAAPAPVSAPASPPASATVSAALSAPAHVVVQRTHEAKPRVEGSTPTPTPAASPFPVIAFDPQAWLIDHPGTPVGNAAVAIAERYLGVPYKWGGNQPSTGFDCSGLTQYVYAQLGVWLPHYAAAQFLAYQRLDPSQLQPGDLVFFEPKPDGPGHVAIYAGEDHIVEAPHTGALVRIGSLSGAAASLGFLGAVRPSDGAISVAPVRRVASVSATDDPGIALALKR